MSITLERHEYRGTKFNVDFYPSLIPQDQVNTWLERLEPLFPDKSNRRRAILYGEEGTSYNIMYNYTPINRVVTAWEKLDGLIKLRDLVERVVGIECNCCIIQRYPNGKVGINPHRDNEMVLGTTICGVSMGAERRIEFERNWKDKVSISLPSGSMYVMNPPTNQNWIHSIPKDETIKTARYSFTFRNYPLDKNN